MEVAKTTADGLAQIRILAEVNRKDKNRVNQKLYRLLCDEAVLITAYENIKSKAGNMTKGSDHRTLDGYSLEMIRAVIQKLETEGFQFSHVRVQEGMTGFQCTGDKLCATGKPYLSILAQKASQ